MITFHYTDWLMTKFLSLAYENPYQYITGVVFHPLHLLNLFLPHSLQTPNLLSVEPSTSSSAATRKPLSWFCRTTFGHFLGGKGMGSKMCLEGFLCGFRRKSIGGPVLQISFMTSINSIHHWRHEYFLSDLICPSLWERVFIKIINPFQKSPLR